MYDLNQSLMNHLKTPEILTELSRITRGVEKEGLRVTYEGELSKTNHPKGLGSALTHKYITTDYSEILLELMTPPSNNIDETLKFLNYLHKISYLNIKNELIWPSSMPGFIGSASDIPLAEYGSSKLGMMKTIYRRGLTSRYGAKMQTISGVHYNFSLPDEFWIKYQHMLGESESLKDFKSKQYFNLIRNFKRHSWLLIYLFGASPVLDSSFLENDMKTSLTVFGENTIGKKYATSMRLSEIGYTSKIQNNFHVSYTNIESYVNSLELLLKTNCKEYEEIGIKEKNNFNQLNTNVLQIENEYYSDIRPKRIPMGNEKQLEALKKEGVEYIEIRNLDVNPFFPLGIDEQQIMFLDLFLLFCLTSPSPQFSEIELLEIKLNKNIVAEEGRNPSLKIKKNGEEVHLKVIALEILKSISPIAEIFDLAYDKSSLYTSNESYKNALSFQVQKVHKSEFTPSGVMMKQIMMGNEFRDLMRFEAKKHKLHFILSDLPNDVDLSFQLEAHNSILRQKQLEIIDEDKS